MENLSKSFPDWTEKKRKRVAKAFYRWLFDVFIETLKALTISKKDLLKRVHFKNPEILEELRGNGGSLIAATSHCGNWEWVLLHGSINLDWMKMDAAYMPVSNPFFEKLMCTIRSRFGAVLIPGNELVRKEITRKEIQRAICMVADQRPMPESAYWLHFLHQTTAAFRGVDTFAKFFNYPVFYLEMLRSKRGYYTLEFIPIGSPPYDKKDMSIMDSYFGCIEKTLAKDPSAWLWTHKRWKDKPSVSME